MNLDPPHPAPGSPEDSPRSAVLIPTRSERQAMDWSLALASQEIPCVIHSPMEGMGSWSLEVASADTRRAFRTLRTYHLENRNWRVTWMTSASTLVFHWAALLWCLLLLMMFWAQTAPGSVMQPRGTMLSSELLHGQWWRPVTATFLHAGVDHLASNLATGFVLLGLAMGRFGPGRALAVSLGAGVLGYLTATLFRPYDHPGLGASGVVMATLGMLTVSMISDLRAQRLAAASLGRGLLGGCALFILLGTSPQSDVLAHTCGFAWGALLTAIGAFLPPPARRGRSADVAAGAVYFLAVTIAWAVALH